mmetsp:Transcript_116949/g.183948  ORF Transcript_116949/g.183948 Transcript_116949/m.183948 type:complete len:258 (-) Transcript_116949:3701-4474(-)
MPVEINVGRLSLVWDINQQLFSEHSKRSMRTKSNFHGLAPMTRYDSRRRCQCKWRRAYVMWLSSYYRVQVIAQLERTIIFNFQLLLGVICASLVVHESTQLQHTRFWFYLQHWSHTLPFQRNLHSRVLRVELQHRFVDLDEFRFEFDHELEKFFTNSPWCVQDCKACIFWQWLHVQLLGISRKHILQRDAHDFALKRSDFAKVSTHRVCSQNAWKDTSTNTRIHGYHGHTSLKVHIVRLDPNTHWDFPAGVYTSACF